jgi:hypothetical protein
MDGLARETAIVARNPEEMTTTPMITTVWRAGPVFILNANFMPKNCGNRGNCIKIAKSVLEKGALARGGNQG